MHIPDGFLDPKVSIGLIGAAAAVLGYCFAKVKAAVTALAHQPAFAGAGEKLGCFAGKGRRVLTKLGEQKIYLMGMVASLVFAGQMFNFPINQGTSGHLIGGVFASVILGPFAGTIVIAAVLLIQSLFFADGGLMAIGANIINMAFGGAMLGYFLYTRLKKFMPEKISIAVSAWMSVVIAALLCSLEVGFSGTIALAEVVKAMFKVHIIIGIGEALITLVLIDIFRKIIPNEENQ